LFRRRLNSQAATESAQPVLHVDEPRPEAALAGLEPLAIVADAEGKPCPVRPDPHVEPGPVPSVLAGVLDGFQAAEVDRRLDLRRVAAEWGGVNGDGQRGPAGHRGQRGRQPALHEDRGIDAVREAPQLIRRLPDVGAELGQDLPDLVIVAVGQLAGQTQLDREGGEPLLGAIVEVALDPAPLAVGGSHDPRPRSLELGRLTAQLLHRGRQRGAEPDVVSGEFSPLGLEETALPGARSQATPDRVPGGPDGQAGLGGIPGERAEQCRENQAEAPEGQGMPGVVPGKARLEVVGEPQAGR
jgi:hypothetical protein